VLFLKIANFFFPILYIPRFDARPEGIKELPASDPKSFFCLGGFHPAIR